jgi:hypothetical protein
VSFVELYEATFPGSQGDAWPAAWEWLVVNSDTPPYPRQSGTGWGAVFRSAAGNYSQQHLLVDVSNQSEGRTVGSFRFHTQGASRFFGVMFCHSATNTRYRLTIGHTGSNNVTLSRVDGGSSTNPGTAATVSITTANDVHYIAECVELSAGELTLRIKVWQGDPVTDEPGSWTFSYTDTSPLPAGKVGLYFGNNVGDATVEYTTPWRVHQTTFYEPATVAVDPTGFDVTIVGTTAQLSWDAPDMAGATHVDVFHRAANDDTPFDPETDTRIHRVGVATTSWDHEGLSEGHHAWQVFPVQVD